MRSQLFDDLGQYRRPVTTASDEARAYFDQGLVLTYGFNHAAAIRSFRVASGLDPTCALCFAAFKTCLGLWPKR